MKKLILALFCTLLSFTSLGYAQEDEAIPVQTYCMMRADEIQELRFCKAWEKSWEKWAEKSDSAIRPGASDETHYLVLVQVSFDSESDKFTVFYQSFVMLIELNPLSLGVWAKAQVIEPGDMKDEQLKVIGQLMKNLETFVPIMMGAIGEIIKPCGIEKKQQSVRRGNEENDFDNSPGVGGIMGMGPASLWRVPRAGHLLV